MNQAQTRMYYNTMAIVDDGVGFIVGLLAEAVAGEKTQLRRQRMLLSYFPDWQVHSQVYPVASTTLAVMTRKDCLAAPDKVPFAMTEWFRRYPMITTVTYFETEMHDQAPLLHLLPGDRWRTPIQLAQEQLARDCQLFASGKKTSLKLIQPDLTRLGY